MRPDRQARVLAWLQELGSGPFTYRQVAEATVMTRDQAWAACLALADRGAVDYVQWVGHYGTHTYELRGVTHSGPARSPS